MQNNNFKEIPTDAIKVKENSESPKMTFKERKEFELLTIEIEQLTTEKDELDILFNSGKEIHDIIEKSAKYNELKELLDEKEMRWLELSEKE